jgi:hypothetical protein
VIKATGNVNVPQPKASRDMCSEHTARHAHGKTPRKTASPGKTPEVDEHGNPK